MNVDKNFWRNPNKWPRDDPGHVFLARAVHEIGKYLFDGKWTGQEPTIQRPDMAHFKEWQIARARFEKVIEQIASWIRTDKLVLGLRRVRGGEILSPYPAKLWENKQWKFRFYRCMVNPNSHDDNSVGGPHHQYIYVTRESLNNCLKVGGEQLALQHSALSSKPGRKLGDVQYPDDSKIMTVLAKQFRSDQTLQGLTGLMVLHAAESVGLATKDFNAEGVTRRIRPKLKKQYSDIADRMSKKKIA